MKDTFELDVWRNGAHVSEAKLDQWQMIERFPAVLVLFEQDPHVNEVVVNASYGQSIFTRVRGGTRSRRTGLHSVAQLARKAESKAHDALGASSSDRLRDAHEHNAQAVSDLARAVQHLVRYLRGEDLPF